MPTNWYGFDLAAAHIHRFMNARGSIADDELAEAANWHPARARSADFSAKSNLALAFLCLPPAKRQDMNVFYTFCRLVDDIADTGTLPPEEKAELLNAWRTALATPAPAGTDANALLVSELHALMAKYPIPVEHLLEIIAGVEMDVGGKQYHTFEQLRTYCHRVASVVGLVSIEVFGYEDPSCRQYALDLGMALQLTNIIRDVGVDLDNGGRIYLPMEDLERFGYTTADLRARTNDKRFQALMKFESARAEEFYRSALTHLSSRDRRSMTAAEIMREIYWKLLKDIRADRFNVFARRYRLSKPRKVWTLFVTMLRTRFLPI